MLIRLLYPWIRHTPTLCSVRSARPWAPRRGASVAGATCAATRATLPRPGPTTAAPCVPRASTKRRPRRTCVRHTLSAWRPCWSRRFSSRVRTRHARPACPWIRPITRRTCGRVRTRPWRAPCPRAQLRRPRPQLLRHVQHHPWSWNTGALMVIIVHAKSCPCRIPGFCLTDQHTLPRPLGLRLSTGQHPRPLWLTDQHPQPRPHSPQQHVRGKGRGQASGSTPQARHTHVACNMYAMVTIQRRRHPHSITHPGAAWCNTPRTIARNSFAWPQSQWDTT
jgi:hypothetical protein